MTLEICSCTFWTRIEKGSRHVDMNSITLGKFEDSIWAILIPFSFTTKITVRMVNFLWPIHININVALTWTKNKWCCIKRINSVKGTSELSIWCIVSRTDIVFNIFPNNWIEFSVLIKLTIFWEDVIKKFLPWFS